MSSKPEGRVFLRGIVSKKYGLDELRRSTLDAPRVRGEKVVTDDGSVAHSGDSEHSSTYWRLGPGDDPFLTQTLQVHFVDMEPHSANAGHGHQNEAMFYIIEGYGHEVHDERRYEWKQGDVVTVHTDSVHRHYNDSDQKAHCLVIKAKSLWMYLGLIQQGKIGGFADPEGRYGPREDWSLIWTEGVDDLKKIVTPSETPLEHDGVAPVRRLTGPGREDVRCFSVDTYQYEIEAGGRSSRYWMMADEVFYVVSGRGTSVHWEVGADIDERFHARVAKEPTHHEIERGDVLWVPQNTVRQHINSSEDEPLVLLGTRNSMFRHLGYDRTHILEPGQ